MFPFENINVVTEIDFIKRLSLTLFVLPKFYQCLLQKITVLNVSLRSIYVHINLFVGFFDNILVMSANEMQTPAIYKPNEK